jgi:predicted extracellular nuclease
MNPLFTPLLARMLLLWLAALLFSISAFAAPAPARSEPLRIHDIQGRVHVSTFNGRQISNVPGIVTAVRERGFYMEDWQPDNDPATSEGIYVATSSSPNARVGDRVRVSGRVEERRPGGEVAGANNLSLTCIVASSVSIDPAGGPSLPPPVILGPGGRRLDHRALSGAAPGGDVEATPRLDPARYAIDFYESLEAMRVVVPAAKTVGPMSFNEVVIEVPAGGVGAAPAQSPSARIVVSGAILPKGRLPRLDAGDAVEAVNGIVDYSYGRYKLLVTDKPRVVRARAPREVTALRGDTDHLTLASLNVHNLDATDAARRFQKLAVQIVRHLQSPDVLALNEVQDDNGPIDDGRTGARLTIGRLLAAIQAESGPAYAHREIDPRANEDGGEPGGNIRQVLLFNPARVSFVDRPAAGDAGGVTVVHTDHGPALTASPGRIAPGHPAFRSSRKPLAGQFSFNGHTLFVIANHFASKRRDTPAWGRFQPAASTTEPQRIEQAGVVAGFVRSLLAADAQASVVVLGDLNDDESSATLKALERAPLVNPALRLPRADRYTHIYQGEARMLDHALVSPALAARAEPMIDAVHVNAAYAEAASDHDPVLLRLSLPARGRRR